MLPFSGPVPPSTKHYRPLRKPSLFFCSRARPIHTGVISSISECVRKAHNSYMGSKRNFLWMDGAAVNDANANYLLIFLALQGTGHCTKMDNFFRELPKGGGVIFDPTIYIADFVTLNRAFWEWNWYKRIMSGLSRLDIFRKFIRFDAVSQWPVSNQQELPLLSLQYV